MYSLFLYDVTGRALKVKTSLNLARSLSCLAIVCENGTCATYAKIYNTNDYTLSNPLGEVLKHNFK